MSGRNPQTAENLARLFTMSSKIGRPVRRPSNDDGTVQPPLSSPNFRDRWPDLFKFLAQHRGSGQNPSTGTLTLFLEQGCFKLCLNDRPNARSAFVSGKTIVLAFDAASVGIGRGTINWRQKGYKPAQDRQRQFSQA